MFLYVLFYVIITNKVPVTVMQAYMSLPRYIRKGMLIRWIITSDLCCCCCSAYLSSCLRTASDANLLDDPHTFHCVNYFVFGGIRTCLEVSNDPMFWSISSNSLSTEFPVCSKPPSPDNHSRV